MRTHLTLTISQEAEPCDLRLEEAPRTMEVKADLTDHNVDAWFQIFADVLRAVGFQDTSIARGACRVAFNEYRAPESMQALYTEFELDEFHQDNATPPAQESGRAQLELDLQ